MHLFIEESFLIDFEIEYNNVYPSVGQNCLHKIFTEYTGIRLYFDNIEKLKELNSKYFNTLTDYNPNIKEIKDFNTYFENIQEIPNQTIVLSSINLLCKTKIEQLGAVCLDFGNYEVILKNIIEKLHLKFSLSDLEKKFSWNSLSISGLIPIKSVVIDDPYILINKKGQLMKDNIIPLIKNLLLNQKIKPSLTIFSDVIENPSDRWKNEIERVELRYSILEQELKPYISTICIAKSKQDQAIFVQHDRYIYTPFTIISVGKGFNIFPYERENSKIEQSTIFDKFSYNEMKNHFSGLKEKYEKLKKKEFINTLLKIYPNSEYLNLFID
jgi:hypothetical protein